MTFNPQLIWFLIGLALVLFEFMAPGIILVFFGLGAWTAAISTWVGLTTGWTASVLVFVVSSIIYLVLLRRWFKARFIGFEGDPQNPQENIDEFQGQIVLVTRSIGPDSDDGQVEFKGAPWTARSKSIIAEGQKARIMEIDSITLIVEPVDR